MANYALFFDSLLQSEGGYNPSDVGLCGKYGIRLDTWQTYGRDLNADSVINCNDIKMITTDDAYKFYKSIFWDALKLDNFRDQSLAEIVFDHGVNAGTSRAAKMIQYILKNNFGFNIAIDGAIGPITLDAVSRVNSQKLFDAFKQMRTWYYQYLGNDPYRNIPQSVQTFFTNTLRIAPQNSLNTYLSGWLDRVQKFIYSEKKTTGIILLLPLLGLGLYAYSRRRK